ncbi:MAG: hypothetical protein SFV18_08510 [Bryobacteraceae bacterium]|nr:hypothetical protein [Bryobacteraceae bacterium]
MALADLWNWPPFATAVGAAFEGDDLEIAIVRKRPGGVEIVARELFRNVESRPAAEWGTEAAAFLRSRGAEGRAPILVLRDRDCLTRTVALPGVAAKDRANALALQIDTLHPFDEGSAATAWTAAGSTDTALVAIVRHAVVERYANLFAEAGLGLAGITVPAAVVPRRNADTLAFAATEDGLRVYGESAAAPLVWAVGAPLDRARATLRLPESFEPSELASLLPGGSFAAAAAAQIRPAIDLLPRDRRAANRRWTYAPTAALGLIAALSVTALAAFPKIEDYRLRTALGEELTRLRPQAARSAAAEKSRAATAAKAQSLAAFRDRTRLDLEALREVTRLVAAPGWAQQLDMTRTTLAVAGESPQAAELLKAFDASPMFVSAEFTSPLSRSNTPGMDVFRVRASREGAK